MFARSVGFCGARDPSPPASSNSAKPLTVRQPSAVMPAHRRIEVVVAASRSMHYEIRPSQNVGSGRQLWQQALLADHEAGFQVA